MNIPFAKPWLGAEEEQAAVRAIRSGWVSQGPEADAFEREFAAYTGTAHACAVSSATTALHLALKAIDVRPGDEVITVSHSFLATANCIRYMDAIPVFVDIEPLTYNMDPRLIEAAITPKTKAILCVHQIGMPCNLAAILSVAQRHGLKVVEDAAPAIGSEILWNGRWEKIGRAHGDVTCFSFHARKIITTGDGGLITTNNPDYDAQFRRWRCHGMNMSSDARHGAKTVAFEEYVELGYNYRLTDIQAAVGREQLKKVPEIVRRRRELAARYRQLLSGIPDLELPIEPEWARTNWQSYCVLLPEWADQLDVMQRMLDQGVATRRGVHTSHMEPAYEIEPWKCGGDRTTCGCQPRRCRCLPESERARLSGLLLPLFYHMTDAEQEGVCAVLAGILWRG